MVPKSFLLTFRCLWNSALALDQLLSRKLPSDKQSSACQTSQSHESVVCCPRLAVSRTPQKGEAIIRLAFAAQPADIVDTTTKLPSGDLTV